MEQNTENRLNPIVRVILQGVYDVGSPLSQLLGMPHVLQIIWNKLTAYWKMNINVSKIIRYVLVPERPEVVSGNLGYFEARYHRTFPTPLDLNINMMPFVLTDIFIDSWLPDNVEPYWEEFIHPAIKDQRDEIDKICYLTIHESFVDKQCSQRRPGIHTEMPGFVYINNVTTNTTKGKGLSTCEPKYLDVYWGRGYISQNKCKGGIYMASSVDNSCELWNCRILQDKNGQEIIGKLGDVDYLREFLPESEIAKKNTLYWLTDRTPHESLPLKEGTYRQFFRLVMSEVSVWFEDHSTKNPFGILPDPAITKVVRGSKFDGNGVVQESLGDKQCWI